MFFHRCCDCCTGVQTPPLMHANIILLKYPLHPFIFEDLRYFYFGCMRVRSSQCDNVTRYSLRLLHHSPVAAGNWTSQGFISAKQALYWGAIFPAPLYLMTRLSLNLQWPSSFSRLRAVTTGVKPLHLAKFSFLINSQWQLTTQSTQSCLRTLP